MIRVMIADDSIEFSLTCRNFLTKDNNIEVISMVHNGLDTIRQYCILQPDVLLLDLELPEVNGLEIIDILSKEQFERNKCNIVVVSGASYLMPKLLNTSKVFRIMPKPISFTEMLSTIKEIKPVDTAKLTRKKIIELLMNLKFNVNTKGIKYLIEAIELSYEDLTILENIGDVYKIIAKNHNDSPSAIQWRIRSSLNTMKRVVSTKDIQKVLPLYDPIDTVTPKRIITLIIEMYYPEC